MMPEREKVIKGLEIHTGWFSSCKDGCPYFTGDGNKCNDMLKDALALLQEQNAIKPKTGYWIWLQYCANEGVYCSECHKKMFDHYPMKKKLSQFCGHCGAKMNDEVEVR